MEVIVLGFGAAEQLLHARAVDWADLTWRCLVTNALKAADAV